MTATKRNKVFVALSGGVDSSVSAALLSYDGFDVTGVFIKVWQPANMPCSWREDRIDAMRVCAHLRIPFRTLDLAHEYKRGVVDYMLGEYEKGLTPNPDVMCNKRIKFGAFLDFSQSEGVHSIATGHHARIERVPTSAGNSLKLVRGVDRDKDQSYFLWTLGERELRRTLFPIGKFTKSEVRALARKFNLPTAYKPDSQGLCFVGDFDMKSFLKEYAHATKGDVLNRAGEVVGEHEGSILYTEGERHGFKISNKRPHSKAQYVVAKDVRANTITVAPVDMISTNNFRIALREVNWIGKRVASNELVKAQVRYHGKLYLCSVQSKNDDNDNIELNFTNGVEPVSSGQSAVLYSGDTCLGGGIIC